MARYVESDPVDKLAKGATAPGRVDRGVVAYSHEIVVARVKKRCLTQQVNQLRIDNKPHNTI